MKLKIAWIGKTKDPAIQSLTDKYVKRIGRYVPVEAIAVKDEAGLTRLNAGKPCTLVVLDSRGKQFSSEELAKFLGDYRDRNPLPLVLAIGPADGFSDATRKSSSFQISLGRMTLPHELARIVLLEQIYRAFTILAGHPYHTGH